jgi:nitrite reductase (NADH) small subunit
MAVSERAAPEPLRVGSLSDFRLDAWQLLEVEGREIGIIRTDAGVFAVRNRCPHRGGSICVGPVGGVMTADLPESITYDESRKAVRCPWHGWQFLLDDGHAVGGISRRRLQRYPVEVHDGEVYVHIRPSGRSEEPQL